MKYFEKNKSAFILSRRAAIGLIISLLSSGAFAEHIYQTTLELQAPVTAAGIDRVEFIWSVDHAHKHAGGDKLSGLAMALYAGNTLVYTDLVIAEWLLLPMMSREALTERSRKDIFWDFDLENMTLRQFRSILPKSLGGSSGEHYQVADGRTLPHDGNVYIRHYVNGVRKELKVGALLTQSTRLLKSFDPPTGGIDRTPPEEMRTTNLSSVTDEQEQAPGRNNDDNRPSAGATFMAASS